MLQCIVVALMMGGAACSGDADGGDAFSTGDYRQDEYQEDKNPNENDEEGRVPSLDDDREVEQLIIETVELLTGGYLDSENALMAAEEIFSHRQVISQVQELLSSSDQGQIDKYSLIYIAGLSGRSEFSEILFTLASAPRLNPELATEQQYEKLEKERIAALRALGRLGDIDRLKKLLELVPGESQITVWLELYQLDGDRWPMRKLPVELGEDLLSDPDYREMYESLIEGLDVDVEGVVVLDDEDDECEELEGWPEDELELALLECEGEDCDELWELAAKCDRGCVLGCVKRFEDSRDIETHIQLAEANLAPKENNMTYAASVAQAPRSCPNVTQAVIASNDELGLYVPIQQFKTLSLHLPQLFAAILAAAAIETGHAREWCNARVIQNYKDRYNFDGSWDADMGAGTPCDLNTALGRILNAIHLLHTASPREPIAGFIRYNDLLAEGGVYTQNEIPEMVASCNQKNASMSVRALLRKKKRRLTVFPAGFYGSSTAERAAVIIHEARHTERCRHNGNDGKNRCPSGSTSCDESVVDGCKRRALGPGKGQPGAVAYGVRWTELYLAQAPANKIDDFQRDRANSDANFRLNHRFDVDPGYNITARGEAVSCARYAEISGNIECEPR